MNTETNNKNKTETTATTNGTNMDMALMDTIDGTTTVVTLEEAAAEEILSELSGRGLPPDSDDDFCSVPTDEESDLLSDNEITVISAASPGKEELSQALTSLTVQQEEKRKRMCGSLKRKFHKLLAEGKTQSEAYAILDERWKKGKEENRGVTKPVTIPKKRSRSDESTPSSENKKPRSQAQLSYSEAANVIRVGVAPKNHPAMCFNDEQAKKVQSSILAAIEDAPIGKEIRFMGASRKPGWISLNCANVISRDWLKEALPKLTPYPGADLKLLEGEDYPKQTIGTVYFPDEENLPEERILCRLKKQNNGLQTQYWKVLRKVSDNRGQLMVFSIDETSIRILKGMDCRPWFGFDRVKIRLKGTGEHTAKGEDPKEKAKDANQPAPSTSKRQEEIPQRPRTPPKHEEKKGQDKTTPPIASTSGWHRVIHSHAERRSFRPPLHSARRTQGTTEGVRGSRADRRPVRSRGGNRTPSGKPSGPSDARRR
jgi:hypothetical protein